jgi:hypothetical protein
VISALRSEKTSVSPLSTVVTGSTALSSHKIDTVITKVGKGKAKVESHPKELTGNAEGAGE